MKNINFIALVFLLFFSQTVFSQWTGAGIAQNPFQIHTIQDLEKILEHESDFTITYPYSGPYTNIHFALMQNIDEPLEKKIANSFFGHFHGKGHYITLEIDNTDRQNDYLIFASYGTIDSLTVKGNIFNMQALIGGNHGTISYLVCDLETIPFSADVSYCGIFYSNGNTGIIEYCTNNTSLYAATISGLFVYSNTGIINSCINYGNIYTNQQFVEVFIFNFDNSGQIKNCINCGNIEIAGVPDYSQVACFTYSSQFYPNSIIENCLNIGNISAKKCEYAGIFTGISGGKISNCLNIGTLIGQDIAGGIVGQIYSGSITENCLNAGNIIGIYSVGGIFGKYVNGGAENCIVKNNLSLHKTSKYSIIGDTDINIFNDPLLILENNFYDKQMAPQAATILGDIVENNAAKGLLTTEITGFALQEILGEGWSYAEGRYPIPLGLENNPAALMAATPMYLSYEDTEHYNTVDSVTCHFTVGTENAVAWAVEGSNIFLQGENAYLLNENAYEVLTVSLEGFFKNILLHIQSICVPTYTVSGTVTTNGTPLEGVEICRDAACLVSAFTNASGYYSFIVLEGTYITLTPILEGYTFSPQDTTITNITENKTVNFTANLISLAEHNQNSKTTIYPSPTSGILYFSNETIFEITDLQGRLLLKSDQAVKSVNISDLKAGIYFIKVGNQIQKFVKSQY